MDDDDVDFAEVDGREVTIENLVDLEGEETPRPA